MRRQENNAEDTEDAEKRRGTKASDREGEGERRRRREPSPQTTRLGHPGEQGWAAVHTRETPTRTDPSKLGRAESGLPLGNTRGGPGLEEAGADAVGEMARSMSVRKSMVLNSRSMAGAADTGGNIEQGAEEPRRTRDLDGRAGGAAGAAGLRHGAEARFDEVLGFQGVVHGGAEVFVLRGDGIAAEEIARFGAGGINGQALPEAVENQGVAEIDVNTGAAELERLLCGPDHRV